MNVTLFQDLKCELDNSGGVNVWGSSIVEKLKWK